MIAHLDRYLAELRALGRSEHTIRNYGHDLRSFLRWKGERTDDRATVRDYLGVLRARGVAPGSIRRVAVSVGGFYRWLDREGLVVQPRDGTSILTMRPPKSPHTLPRSIEEDDAIALVTAFAEEDDPLSQRDTALLELLYASGLRVAEASRLDVGDIDLAEKVVIVRRGKGDRSRVVPFGDPARLALALYIEHARPVLARDGETALFVNHHGRRLGDRSVQTVVREAARFVGIEQDVTPHTLRHSLATHMMRGGADLRVVQALLGHSSPETTMIYTEVDPGRQAATVTNALAAARLTRHQHAPQGRGGA